MAAAPATQHDDIAATRRATSEGRSLAATGLFAAGARRVFPFGLGEQPVGLAGLLGEPRVFNGIFWVAQLSDDCFAFGGPLISIAEVERLLAAGGQLRSLPLRR